MSHWMPLQAHDGIALDWSCRRQIVSGNRRKVRAKEMPYDCERLEPERERSA